MRNPWIRRLAYLVGGLATLVVVLLVVVYGITSARMRQRFDVASTPVPVAHDSATVARGEHLVAVIGKCGECHGDDFGGKVFIDDPALGRVVAKNISNGGALAQYTDAEYARAIRHGVSRDGHGLLFMPSDDYSQLSDDDVGAMIAYLRSRPALVRTLPASVIRPVGRALWASGQLPLIAAARIDHTRPSVAHVVAAPTAEYGHYLANTGGCTGCHGADLTGGRIPGTPPDWPPAANLTPAGKIGHWSENDFRQALRTGRRPDGTAIDSVMPWKAAGKMTDDEMHAVYEYLKTVPPKATKSD